MQTHNSNVRPSVRKQKPDIQAAALPYPATFDELLERYQQEREPATATLKGYKEAVKMFIRHSDCQTLDSITRQHIVDWRTHMRDERKLSPASINSYLRSLRALLRFADLHGYHSAEVLAGIKTVQAVKPTKKTIEQVSLKNLLVWLRDQEQAGLPGWFWEGVVKCLYYTGMRRRQLVGLTWGDIDYKQQTILLRGEHSKTKREWKIPLPPWLLPVLTDMRKLSENKLGRTCRRNDQVFNVTLFNPDYKGDRMTWEHVAGAFKRISKRSGVKVSPHRFRHTFATQLAKQGNLRDLQQMLGHTNLSTTMEYVEPSVNQMRDMLGAIHEI